MSNTNLSLLARNNIEAQRARSIEAPGEQPTPSSNEVVSVNTAATKILTDAIKPLAIEYEQQRQKLEDRDKELKDAEVAIAQQEKLIAEAKALHAEGKTKLETAQNELKAEGEKQSTQVKEKLGEAVNLVGEDSETLSDILQNVPAGLTTGDAKNILAKSYDQLAPEIATNLVNPNKKFGDMSPNEQIRAMEAENDLMYKPGTMDEKLTQLKQTEQVADQQKAQRDVAVQKKIGTLVADIPEGEKGAMTDSLNTGLQALEKSGTTDEQRVNIKNALGAEVGSKVITSDGRTFEVTGHKDGAVTLRGEDIGTGGTVEQKVPYDKFRVTTLDGGQSLTEKYEQTFGAGLDIKPTPATPTPAASAGTPPAKPNSTPPAAPAATASKEPPIKTPMTPEQRRKIATDAVLGGFENPNVKVDPILQKRIDDYLKRTQGGETPEEFEKWVLNNEFDRGFHPTVTSKNRSNRIEQERKVRKNTSSSVPASTVPAGGEKPQMSSELKRNIAKDVMSYGQSGIQLPPENAKRMQEYVNSSPNNETRQDFISRIRTAESDILQKKVQEHKQQVAAPTPVDPVNAPATTNEGAPTPPTARGQQKSESSNKPKYESKQITQEITFGEIAAQYGLDIGRLNDLNATDYKKDSLLKKGSELVVPTTPDASVPAATPKPAASAIPTAPTAPASAPAPTDEGDANHGGGTNTHGNGETARDFVPVEPTGSARPVPVENASIPAQTPSDVSVSPTTNDSGETAGGAEDEKKVDASLGFDKLQGKKYGNNTILDTKTSDGSNVSVYRDENRRTVSIGKDLRLADNSVYGADIHITFKNDGSINEIVNTENWDTITGNERTKILEELKKIGLTLPS